MAKETRDKKVVAVLPGEAGIVSKKDVARYQDIVSKVEKRDGSIVSFDFEKIAVAIHKAMKATEEGSAEEATLVAHQVMGEIVRMARKYKNFLPTVEGIQDDIERHLILNNYAKTAKSFILYRDKRVMI